MTSIRVSSKHPGTIIRSAFALESAVNIIFATSTILYPETALLGVVRSPQFITPTATFLLQTTGSILYALTVPLLTCLPNTRRAIESRRTVYYTLGAGEIFLIPLLVWKAATREETGLHTEVLWSGAINLLPVLAWRVYTLIWKPQWFGVIEDEEEEQKTP